MALEYDHSDYMRYTIRTDKLRFTVNSAIKFLEDKDFDTVAFSGNSGVLLGSAIALAMNKHMILVRKEGERSHAHQICEGYSAPCKYVIVDDFVHSGTTVFWIKDEINSWSPDSGLVGVLECCRLIDNKASFWHTKFPYGRRG